MELRNEIGGLSAPALDGQHRRLVHLEVQWGYKNWENKVKLKEVKRKVFRWKPCLALVSGHKKTPQKRGVWCPRKESQGIDSVDKIIKSRHFCADRLYVMNIWF